MLKLEDHILEELVYPISNQLEQGIDLREGSHQASVLYHIVKELRYNARTSEKHSAAADEEQFIKPAEWEDILTKCYELLTKHSKDLEISTWFIEALVRLFSFKGLSFGFKFLSELIKKYHINLYPLANANRNDEEEWLSCLGFLAGMAGNVNHEGTLLTPIRSTPLTENFLYSLWQIKQAYELEHKSKNETSSSNHQNQSSPFQKIKTDINESRINFLQETQKYIEESINSLEELSIVINSHYKNNHISFHNIKDLLMECKRTFMFLAGERLEAEQSKREPKGEESLSENTKKLVSIETEQGHDHFFYHDVSKLLKEINVECVLHPGKYSAPLVKENIIKFINYLSQTLKLMESFSPLPYFLDKAVHLNTLSFAEMLNELDLSPRDISSERFTKLTGIHLTKETNRENENSRCS